MTAQELQFFDAVAPYWDSRDYLSTAAKLKAIMRMGGVRVGQSVLDLGTGTGVLLPYIASAVGECGVVTAVDLSAGMLGLARCKNSGLRPVPRFLNLDFERENIPGRYDHIIMYCVYPHMETPVATLSALRERNLRPGGNMLIAFPCSCERINSIHRREEVDADLLPTPHVLAERLCIRGLPARVLSDTDNLYMVEITDEASNTDLTIFNNCI